jgi:hypothetical protein
VDRADIEQARPFRWLWQDRILLGYLNLMVGEEGVGKSTFVCHVAARTTRGELPGTLDGEPHSIVIVGDEDSWKHVWTPRLHAAGADTDRCMRISRADGIDITDAEQMTNLEAFIEEHDVKLVFFDAMLDNIGYTDSWKDKQVRQAFAKLRQVADKTDCSVLFSMHPNKRGGTFRERVSGTPAFNALSRSSLFIAKHPTELGRVVMVRAKGNYSKEPLAYEFSIEEIEVVTEHVPAGITTTALAHIAETSLSETDIFNGSRDARRDANSKAGYARQRIGELLADRQPHKSAEVVAQIRSERPDIPLTTIKDAATALGVGKQKVGFKDGWVWQLEA